MKKKVILSILALFILGCRVSASIVPKEAPYIYPEPVCLNEPEMNEYFNNSGKAYIQLDFDTRALSDPFYFKNYHTIDLEPDRYDILDHRIVLIQYDEFQIPVYWLQVSTGNELVWIISDSGCITPINEPHNDGEDA